MQPGAREQRRIERRSVSSASRAAIRSSAPDGGPQEHRDEEQLEADGLLHVALKPVVRFNSSKQTLCEMHFGKKTIFPLQTKKRERTERCDAQFKLNSNFFVPV